MSYIKIENYTLAINKNIILNNINLELEKGKIYGLSGKNGSGKTMLIRCICGFFSNSQGKVIVDGVEVGKGVYANDIGLLIEHITLPEHMSAFENLRTLNLISNKKISNNEISKWLCKFNLNANDKRPMKKYSLGMCQKVSIIQAFMNNPSLILLDEPTNALDEASIDYLKSLIVNTNKEQKTTFIIASHDKESLNDICDEIIEMRDGQIV